MVKPHFRYAIFALFLLHLITPSLLASPSALPVTVSFGGANPQQVSMALKILGLLTLLALAPSLLIMTTSFVRIIIVLSFLRQALGTQALPPNQLLVALALFLTFFVMAPTWKQVYSESLEPYFAQKIDETTAFQRAEQKIRTFMFRQTRDKDLGLFVKLAHQPPPRTRADVSTILLMPAFLISELKTAFEIAFLIYVPFLVLDMVVASVLMAMGMMMLPPVVISLPFKLILFVLVDGWALITGSLVQSFGHP